MEHMSQRGAGDSGANIVEGDEQYNNVEYSLSIGFCCDEC